MARTPSSKTGAPVADTTWTNPQIATVAVFLLGGANHAIDIEDVAVKANALAPKRFAWRKYPDQINIAKISTALFDARKVKNGELVLGSDSEGWRLAPAGLEYARTHASQIADADLSRIPMNARERQWHGSERLRLLGEPAFQKFCGDQFEAITRREAEAFFRLDDYVAGAAREKKIARLLEGFDSDAHLGEAVKAISQILRKPRGKTIS